MGELCGLVNSYLAQSRQTLDRYCIQQTQFTDDMGAWEKDVMMHGVLYSNVQRTHIWKGNYLLNGLKFKFVFTKIMPTSHYRRSASTLDFYASSLNEPSITQSDQETSYANHVMLCATRVSNRHRTDVCVKRGVVRTHKIKRKMWITPSIASREHNS